MGQDINGLDRDTHYMSQAETTSSGDCVGRISILHSERDPVTLNYPTLAELSEVPSPYNTSTKYHWYTKISLHLLSHCLKGGTF